MDQKIEFIQPHVIKTPELPRDFKLLRLVYKDPALESTGEAKIADNIMAAFNAVRAWSVCARQEPLMVTEPLDEKRMEELKYGFSQSAKLFDIVSQLTKDYKKPKKQSGISKEYVQDIHKQMQSAVEPLGFANLDQANQQYIDIPIDDIQDFAFFLEYKLGALCHDSKNYTFIPTGYVTAIKNEIFQGDQVIMAVDCINQRMSEFDQFIAARLMEDQKREMNCFDIQSAFKTFLKGRIDLLKKATPGLTYLFNVQIREDLPGMDLKILWSKERMQDIFTNMGDNIAKSIINRLRNLGLITIEDDGQQKPILTLEDLLERVKVNENKVKDNPLVITTQMRITLTDDNKNIDSIIEDEGTGYPEELIAHGLAAAHEKGQTGYNPTQIPGHPPVDQLVRIPSEGIGMLKQIALLEEYGGVFLISNNVDHLNNVIGGVSTLRLPIIQVSQPPGEKTNGVVPLVKEAVQT